MKVDVHTIDLIFPFTSDEDIVCLIGTSDVATVRELGHLKEWMQKYCVERIDFQARIIRSKHYREDGDEERPEKCNVTLIVDHTGSASARMILMASEFFYKKMFDVAISRPKSGEIYMVERGAKYKDLGEGRYEASIEVDLEKLSFSL